MPIALFQVVCYIRGMAFDFEKLKAVAKRLGGILVMQGSEPEFVLMSYENYEKMGTGEPAPAPVPSMAAEDEHLIEQLNNEILALKEEIRQKEGFDS